MHLFFYLLQSSILQAILGELNPNSGSICVNSPSISYASQDPWVFSASVRQNITFGQTYDSNRYSAVCRSCSLYPDFQQFPGGDLTIVGERGASLSGGQKARINLARYLCLYPSLFSIKNANIFNAKVIKSRPPRDTAA